jgi:hypothetical protein
MMVFIDRLTDLLEIDKDTGRKLRTKTMAVVSTSLGDNLGESFWLPFMATAKYLGMEYAGHIDINFSKSINKAGELGKLQSFVKNLNHSR